MFLCSIFWHREVLTKWSITIIFVCLCVCVCVKSSSNFWAFQTGPWNVAQWTPASQTIQVRKGRDFWFLAALTDSLQWTNVAKSHKEKKQYTEKCNWIKKLQETMHTLKYSMYANLAIETVKLSANFQLVTLILDRHYYSYLTDRNIKVTTNIKGLAHESPHHPLVTGLGLQSCSSHPCGLLTHVLIQQPYDCL